MRAMNAMPPRRTCCLWSRAQFLLWLCALPALPSCTQGRSDGLALGQRPAEYDGILPAETSRRTSLGLCRLERSGPSVRATVALLSDDRRVAAIVRAELGGRAEPFGRDGGYRLAGEVDLRLFQTQTASPFDVLRLIALELSDYRGEKLATDAHACAAIGLVRLLERFPHVEAPRPSAPGIDEFADRAPAGGLAEISVAADGVLRFGYEAPR